MTSLLLDWYDANHRKLPWRVEGKAKPDPYAIWLSEIMLQQTTVAAVVPYYAAFLKRWPNVKALARASQDEVLSAWAGLGYYSRARNLHRAAQILAASGGTFPRSSAELRKLPGIGAYTSAAIAAVAFGERVAAMDTNADRVIARIFAVEEPLPKSRETLSRLATPLVSETRAGDFAQALMELGATVCSPKKPLCPDCPVSSVCSARAQGIQDQLPRKAEKPERPVRRGAAFVALDSRGAVYLERRPENGLLGGMLQPPLGLWHAEFPSAKAMLNEAPFTGRWEEKPGIARHVFTHFAMEAKVFVARFKSRPNGEGVWLSEKECETSALPTAMKKIIAHARDEGGPLFDRPKA